jgi:hypothetical protein
MLSHTKKAAITFRAGVIRGGEEIIVTQVPYPPFSMHVITFLDTAVLQMRDGIGFIDSAIAKLELDLLHVIDFIELTTTAVLCKSRKCNRELRECD